MNTQATDSGAVVFRPTLTSHLRPGRLRTALRPGAIQHDAAARFLHQGLHLRPCTPLAAPAHHPAAGPKIDPGGC